MAFNDWLRTFTHLEAVHLDADTARDEPSLSGKSAWSLRLYHGRWQRGVTAGGCRNNADTFHLNPKLALTLRHQDEVVIALNQHASVEPREHRRSRGAATRWGQRHRVRSGKSIFQVQKV